jgi:hypothetical protein
MQPDKAASAPEAKPPAPGQLTPSEAKLRIQKIGRNYRVKIVKTDGTKIAGFINSIDADSFSISNGNAITGFHFFTIPYADVATVRSPFHAVVLPFHAVLKADDKARNVIEIGTIILIGTCMAAAIVVAIVTL